MSSVIINRFWTTHKNKERKQLKTLSKKGLQSGTEEHVIGEDVNPIEKAKIELAGRRDGKWTKILKE